MQSIPNLPLPSRNKKKHPPPRSIASQNNWIVFTSDIHTKIKQEINEASVNAISAISLLAPNILSSQFSDARNEIIEIIKQGAIDDFQHFHDISTPSPISIELNKKFDTLQKDTKLTQQDLTLIINSTSFYRDVYTCCELHLKKNTPPPTPMDTHTHQLAKRIIHSILLLLRNHTFVDNTFKCIHVQNRIIYPQSPSELAQISHTLKTPHPFADKPVLNIHIHLVSINQHFVALRHLKKDPSHSLSHHHLLSFEDFTKSLYFILGFNQSKISHSIKAYPDIPYPFLYACDLLKSCHPKTLPPHYFTHLMPLVPLKQCLKHLKEHPLNRTETTQRLFELIHIAATMLCVQATTFMPTETIPLTLHTNMTISHLKTDLLSWCTQNLDTHTPLIRPFIDAYLLAISKGDIPFVLSLSIDDTSVANLSELVSTIVKHPLCGWDGLYTVLTHPKLPSKQRTSYQADTLSLLQQISVIQLESLVKPAYEKMAKKWRKSMKQSSAVHWEMLLLIRRLYEYTLTSHYSSWGDDQWESLISITNLAKSHLTPPSKPDIFLSARGLVNWLQLALPNVTNDIQTTNKKVDILEERKDYVEFEIFGVYTYVVLGDMQTLPQRLKDVETFEKSTLRNSSFYRDLGILLCCMCFGFKPDSSKWETLDYLRTRLKIPKKKIPITPSPQSESPTISELGTVAKGSHDYIKLGDTECGCI